LPNLKVEIAGDTTSIKNSALAALKAAYKNWPVTVVEGTAGTGDHGAQVQTSTSSTDCGDTDPTQATQSTVYYECVMEQAEVALQVQINNAQSEATALQRQDLIQAIGSGIGNTAAHEIAHQFLLKCCSMDVKISADPNAAATYNQGDSDGDPSTNVPDSDPATYTGYGKDGKTSIHWENTTEQALAKCLGSGWKNYHGEACSTYLQLSQTYGYGQLPSSSLARTSGTRRRDIPAPVQKVTILPFLTHLILWR